MRKSYIYIAGAVILLIIGYIVFSFLSSKRVAVVGEPGNPGSLPQVGNLPPSSYGSPADVASSPVATFPLDSLGATGGSAAPQKFGVVSNESVLDYFVNPQNVVTSIQPDGKIESISSGQSLYLSSIEIKDVIWGGFSYDGKKVLLEFGDKFNPQWSLFDITTKAWTPVSLSATAASWSPFDYEIAYVSRGTKGGALSIMNLSNIKNVSPPKTIANFTDEDFSIAWQTSSTVFLADRSSVFFPGSLYAVNSKTGIISQIVKDRVGIEAKWNASGSQAVIFGGTSVARGGDFGIIDGAGTLLHRFTFLTLSSKCAFGALPGAAPTTTAAASSTPAPLVPVLFCAVPRDSARLANSQLPDAYNQKTLMTADDFYSIGLGDGSISQVFLDASRVLDATNLKNINGVLFFVNRYDQKLYAVSL